MTLGTAETVLQHPAGSYKPHIVAEARLVVARWARIRAARAARAKRAAIPS